MVSSAITEKELQTKIKQTQVIVSNAKKIFTEKSWDYDKKTFALNIYYCRCVGLTDSIVMCSKERIFMPVPIVLRVLVELYADFKNLLENDNYIQRIECGVYSTQLNYAKNLEKLSFETNYVESDEYLKRKKELVDEVNKFDKTDRDKQIKNKFTIAGLEDWYFTVYAILSSHVHNNMLAIEKEHVKVDGSSYDAVINVDFSATRIVHYLFVAVQILVSVSNGIKDLTDKIDVMKVKNMNSSFNRFQEFYFKYSESNQW